MQIFVKAKPNAKKESVEKIDGAHFIVAVKEPPRKGRVNEAIRKVLAEYFGIAVSRVHLVSGFSSRQKKFEIQ
ncbi:MAG: DUF167 domain-containing protein [Patescibacteria group bacterium]